VDDEMTSQLHVTGETAQRSFRVRCVLDDTKADNDIEILQGQRRRVDVALHDQVGMNRTTVAEIGVNGAGEVDAHKGFAVLDEELCETSRSRATFEDDLSLKALKRRAEAPFQPLPGVRFSG